MRKVMRDAYNGPAIHNCSFQSENDANGTPFEQLPTPLLTIARRDDSSFHLNNKIKECGQRRDAK